ncbi:MAG: hypothetical protein II814_09495 [Treponema sp.]|nr:hypothetical protein [Treponema sp.]
MKKIFFAAIILPLSVFVFSCKSSEGAVTRAQENSEAFAEPSASEEAVEAEKGAAENLESQEEAELAEKIPESEFEEFRTLLEEEQEDESGPQQQSPSLAEKIRASNESQEKDEAEEDFGQAPSEYTSQMDGEKTEDARALALSQERNVQNEPPAGRDASSASSAPSALSVPSAPSAPSVPAAASGSGAQTQAQAAAANSGAAATGADAISGAANEAIALTPPQKEDDEAPQEEEKPAPAASRAMTIKNNQFVDIIYPGSGWIYLGEEGSGDHFIFQGRKLGNGETTFSLRSKEPGTALLHFYKNDILTGNYIDDYIEISIGEKSAADGVHVTAPSYAEVVPPKFDRTKAVEEKSAERETAQKQEENDAPATSEEAAPLPKANEAERAERQGENSPSEKVQTVIQTSGQEKAEGKQRTSAAATGPAPAAQAAPSPQKSGEGAGVGSAKASSLLEKAQKAYDEKRYADALDLVQQFFDTATEDIDAGLYLEGLILEAKSEVRNIKSAIGAYDTLIKNWPQSRFWRRANERSIYLKRFYIDIR